MEYVRSKWAGFGKVERWKVWVDKGHGKGRRETIKREDWGREGSR